MKILLEAPILSQSGYGEHARLVHRALRQNDKSEIFINALDWGKTNWISSLRNSIEFDQIQEGIKSLGNLLKENRGKSLDGFFDLQVHVGMLNEFKRRAPYCVHITAGIETDRVSADWVIKTHKEPPTKIIVPSQHSKDVFLSPIYEITKEKTKESFKVSFNENVKLDVVGYPIRIPPPAELDLKIETKFNFLSIALDNERKNLDNLIKWFLEEFKENSDVGLILKTGRSNGSLIDREFTINKIKKITNLHKNSKCKIYLLHGNLSEEEVNSLYNRDDIHAYVTTTCGEGYGLPVFEAAYSGLPIIATDWSGHLDFLSAPFKVNKKSKEKTKKLFLKVDYSLQEVPPSCIWKGVIDKGSKWAFVKEQSLKSQLRKVYKDYGIHKKRARVLKDFLQSTNNEDLILKQLLESIESVLKEQDLESLKIEGNYDEIIL